MILSSSITLIGLMFGRHFISYIDQNEMLSHRQTNRIWNLFIIGQILIFWICLRRPQINLLLQLCVGMLCKSLQISLSGIRRRRFQESHLFLLDYLVLQIRSGISIKDALKNSKTSLQRIDWHISEILSAMEFRGRGLTQDDPAFEGAVEVIVAISKSSSRILERLIAYRSKVRTETFFRQKSKQLSLQVKVQAAVLSFLYVALVVFDFMYFDHNTVIRDFAYSFPLYGAGIIAIMRIPGSFKWKE